MTRGYRVWDNKNKSYNDPYSSAYYAMTQDGGLDFYVHGDIWKGADPGTYIVEQDTGLKDKNGKMIREGDIVKWNDCIMKVVWENDFASFELVYPDNSIEEGMFANEYMRNWEVVGTIHENPELLK